MALAIAGKVVLDLTYAEAQFLVDILDRIGGVASTSRRGMADEMARALSTAGVDGTAADDFPKNAALYLK